MKIAKEPLQVLYMNVHPGNLFTLLHLAAVQVSGGCGTNATNDVVPSQDQSTSGSVNRCRNSNHGTQDLRLNVSNACICRSGEQMRRISKEWFLHMHLIWGFSNHVSRSEDSDMACEYAHLSHRTAHCKTVDSVRWIVHAYELGATQDQPHRRLRVPVPVLENQTMRLGGLEP
jgi:hypothetical protein